MVWLDNTRIIAILAVVMLHVASDFVFDASMGSASWWIGNVYDSAVRWCVPVFVMVSGALLLDPNKTESLSEFYKKRVTRLCIPIVFWTVVYLCWQTVKGEIKGEPETASSLLMSVLNGSPYYHMWFLYMVVGLYLFTPFFRMVVVMASEKALWVLVVVGMVLAMINSGYDIVTEQREGLFINWFLLYIPYFFLGYLLKSVQKTFSVRTLLSLYFSVVFATALGLYLLASMTTLKVGLYFYDYLSITVIPMSVCLMLLFKHCNKPIFNSATVALLSSLTLGVYLVHPMLLEILIFSGMGAMQFTPLVSIPLITLVVYLGALGIAWVLLHLPFLKRCI